MKIKIIAIIFFVLVGSSVGIILAREKDGQVLGEVASNEVVSIYNPTATPSVIEVTSPPVRLRIPSLSVDSKIEEVGADAEGKMDVPKDDMNAGWWRYGAIPGQTGNSVIAGHYDRRDGGPAIFYNLSEIEIGAEIIINDEAGTERIFIVTGKESYKVSNFPLDAVFSKTSEKKLNLITCNGIWDINSQNYSDRLVIFSVLKE